MKSFVQTDNFRLLEEAVKSDCEGVRFGSEFCEYNMPNQYTLEKAYKNVNEAGKEFVYITPRLSNRGIIKLQKQLTLLNEKGKMDVVINDFGALNIITQYRNLCPHLGRQMIRLPARSPWADLLMKEGIFFKPGTKHLLTKGGFLKKRWYSKVLSQSNLNFSQTIDFFLDYGIKKVDIDWIPHILSSFDSMIHKGFNFSIHLHLVPIAFTRKCHMARFLKEKSLQKCSKPCLYRVFLLKNDIANLKFLLNGNVIFSYTQPSHDELRTLMKSNFADYILTMNPITEINSKKRIDEFILLLKNLQN